jgi:hypothetical protein
MQFSLNLRNLPSYLVNILMMSRGAENFNISVFQESRWSYIDIRRNQYPQFIMGVFVQAVFKIEISCSQWEGSGGSLFYFSWEEVVCCQCVPKMFSCDPHNVPQVPNSFPKTFPIAPHFLPRIVWPWFYFHVYSL